MSSGTDAPLAVSIVSLCVSGGSLLFSLYVFLQHRADEKRAERRRFLTDSASAADHLISVLSASLSKPVLLLTDEELAATVVDLSGIAVHEERWRGETFDAAFQSMHQCVVDLIAAQNEYRRSGVTSDDLRAAMSQALAAAEAYSQTAKRRLSV